MTASSQSKHELENANLEYWRNSPLFQATKAMFGDIDHIIRKNNDLIIRGWIISLYKHDFSIHIGLDDNWASPLFVGDYREDVAQAFPRMVQAKTSGCIFLLKNITIHEEALNLNWMIPKQDGIPLIIPIGLKSVTRAEELQLRYDRH